MKKNMNVTKKVGAAKEAKSTQKSDCKLFYAVILEILFVDNDGNHKQVLRTETEFKEPVALTARRKAFAYAEQLENDAQIDGRLYKDHLDSVIESKIKGGRNTHNTFISVYCINIEDDYDMLVSEGGFFLTDRELEGLEVEYMFYTDYGYDTGGSPQIVTDEDGEEYEIISFS
jgi:hypothetical protein